MPELLIGSPESDYIRVEVIGRAHPAATDYWDGNWVNTMISVAVGSWRGRYEASLRTDEFEGFREGVERLYDSLEGEAVFASMEHWLDLRLVGDGLGHIRIEVSAMDRMYPDPSVLDFVLPQIDQTYLPDLVDQLNGIASAYPVIGDRPSLRTPTAHGKRRSRWRRSPS